MYDGAGRVGIVVADPGARQIGNLLQQSRITTYLDDDPVEDSAEGGAIRIREVAGQPQRVMLGLRDAGELRRGAPDVLECAGQPVGDRRLRDLRGGRRITPVGIRVPMRWRRDFSRRAFLRGAGAWGLASLAARCGARRRRVHRERGPAPARQCRRAHAARGLHVAHRGPDERRFSARRYLALRSRWRGRVRDRRRRLDLRVQLRRREPGGGAGAIAFASDGAIIDAYRDPHRHFAQLRGRPHAVGHLALVRGGRSGPRVGVRSVHARIRGRGAPRTRNLQPRGRGRRPRRATCLSHRGPHRRAALPLHAVGVSESRRGHAAGGGDPRPGQPGRDPARSGATARVAHGGEPQPDRRSRPRRASRCPRPRSSTGARAAGTALVS